MAGPAIAAMFHVFFRMTIDAPGHPQRYNTRHSVHRFHGAVTFITGEVGLDVPLMRKMNKVGNIVNFDPRYRFTIFPIGGQLQDFRTFADAGYRVVTSHTFANAGHAGNRRRLGIDVAVLARNLVVRGVNCVTEFDRLNRATIGEIFAVYPCACKQSGYEHKP